MIAARFRSVGWVACIAAAMLVFYMMSQWVAAERGALARTDRQIADTRADIMRLTTEIAARSRMSQLESWNHQVLALKAPAPLQYAASAVELVSRDGATPLPLDPAIVAARGAVDRVALQVPAPARAHPAIIPVSAPAPVAAPPEPLLRQATFVRTRPDRMADSAPVVTRVSFGGGGLLPADIGGLAAREAAARKSRRDRADR